MYFPTIDSSKTMLPIKVELYTLMDIPQILLIIISHKMRQCHLVKMKKQVLVEQSLYMVMIHTV